jgi:hypothetical protein
MFHIDVASELACPLTGRELSGGMRGYSQIVNVNDNFLEVGF